MTCALVADPLATQRVARLTPAVVRSAIAGWRSVDLTPAVVSARFRTLRPALGWAVQARQVDRNPLERMRAPAQPEPRMHAPIADVLKVLPHAERQVGKARADADGGALLAHGVATFLVDRGAILKAQQRLGYQDAWTTLRNYAHALPLEDGEVADALDELLTPSGSGARG